MLIMRALVKDGELIAPFMIQTYPLIYICKDCRAAKNSLGAFCIQLMDFDLGRDVSYI